METETVQNYEFAAFPKIVRYTNVKVAITEKIDGTNACIAFDVHGGMFCQSRKKIITPGKQTDNFGFAAWAHANQIELFEALGPGRHFGEWWGLGIQRGYGLTYRRFSLFNTRRFGGFNRTIGDVPIAAVPLLATGPLPKLADLAFEATRALEEGGSAAAPGFPNPEGVMIYLSNVGYMKHPFDPSPKGQS